MKWRHSRKGIIEGVEVGGDDTWMRVQLTVDHRIPWLSEENRLRRPISPAGEVMTFRRSLMTPLEETA